MSGVQYDKAGNIVQDSVNGQLRNFVFNGDNKQVHVKDVNNQPIGTYFYDGNGARVKKSTASETTIFVYDASSKLVAEYSTATPPTNPTVSYTATDTLGSPRVITDKQGNITSRRDFLPFGEEVNPDANFRKTAFKYGSATDSIRKRFTGYEKDEETGLDFAQARYYNNQHGRFTAVDPLLASGKSANPQTFNRYAYTMNQPLTMTDKTGLQTDETDDVFTTIYTVLYDSVSKAQQSIQTSISRTTCWNGDCARDVQQGIRMLEANNGGMDNPGVKSPLRTNLNDLNGSSTGPAFNGINKSYEKAEPYLNYVPIVGSGSNLAKSIWLGGNGSNNKLEVLGNGAAFTGDFISSFSGIAGGGIKSVGKTGFQAAAESGGSKLAFGLKDNLFNFAKTTGSKTYIEITGSSLFIPEKVEKLALKATEINFNLKNFSFTQHIDWIQRGKPFEAGRATSFELDTVLSNPELRKKTNFFFYPSTPPIQ